MKRKRREVSLKGIPLITKFFKKSSEIKVDSSKILDCKIILDSSSLDKITKKKTESAGQNLKDFMNVQTIKQQPSIHSEQKGKTIVASASPPPAPAQQQQRDLKKDATEPTELDRQPITQQERKGVYSVYHKLSELAQPTDQCVQPTTAIASNNTQNQLSEGTQPVQNQSSKDFQSTSNQPLHDQSNENIKQVIEQKLPPDLETNKVQPPKGDPERQTLSYPEQHQQNETHRPSEPDSQPTHAQSSENELDYDSSSIVDNVTSLEQKIVQDNELTLSIHGEVGSDNTETNASPELNSQPRQSQSSENHLDEYNDSSSVVDNVTSSAQEKELGLSIYAEVGSDNTETFSAEDRASDYLEKEADDKRIFSISTDMENSETDEEIVKSLITTERKEEKLEMEDKNTNSNSTNSLKQNSTSDCFKKQANYKLSYSDNDTDMEYYKTNAESEMTNCYVNVDSEETCESSEDNTDLNNTNSTPTKNKDIPTKEQFKRSQDDVNDSDDELLLPPSFLYDNRSKPAVETPEKCTSPVRGSPLAPISPYKEQDRKTVKCRYSLAKLVLEKPKQEKKDEKMARLQETIHERIKKGRMARSSEDTGTESDADDDSILLPQDQEELSNLAVINKKFEDEIPGEDIFPEFGKPVKLHNGCCKPFPVLESSNEADAFTLSLFKRSDVEIQELLCGGWVVQRYLIRPCSELVIQWLFHVLCYHLDNQTIQASYNALWSLLNAERSNNDQNTQSKFPWIPSTDEFVSVLFNYGATKFSLRQSVEEKKEISTEKDLSVNRYEDESLFPQANLTRAIQFITLCVARYSQQYTGEQLEQLVITLCCLSLDLRMEMCLHDIKTCLEAAYSAFEQNHWSTVAKKLYCIISDLVVHHRNKLHLVQIQPYSCRGRDIKRLVALQALTDLVPNDAKHDNFNEVIKTGKVEADNEITDVAKCLAVLEKVLCEIQITDDLDYYKFYTIVEILDLCVGADTLLPNEKAILARIVTRLRLFNNDIKDPRAMFMNRTKVKDFILRIVSKFDFMTQGKKTMQKGITAFFEKPETDLYIETLKDNEDVDSEISFGSGSDCGSASSNGDISDTTTETNEDLT